MSTAPNLEAAIEKEIKELSTSIAGLVSNFNKLRKPVEESHEKVPQATDQLDKISEQTEAAAHQMLDMVEKITEREGEIIKGVEAIRAEVGGKKADSKLAAPELLDQVSELANANLNDAFTIMDALQFQDITSQQMDHAASLLEDIEGKLHNIISTIDNGQGVEGRILSTVTKREKKKRAFDPHADLFEKKTAQEDIDSLFKGKKE